MFAYIGQDILTLIPSYFSIVEINLFYLTFLRPGLHVIHIAAEIAPVAKV